MIHHSTQCTLSSIRRRALALAATVAVVAAGALSACQPAPAYHHWSETPAATQAEHSPEVIQAWIDAYWRQRWIDAYNWNRWMEESARIEAERAASGRYVQGVEVCNGGSLPPCRVVQRESRFNPAARNPSGAWGLYQFMPRTWRRTCPEFSHGSASVAQQAECARRLWDNGRGASHWKATL